MRKLALLAGVALTLFMGKAALAAPAQGPFADVPTDHWAYDAVNELAALGIFNGYPDQTFGGKRALTRYEFAVALQRMLQDVQRRIDAIKQQPGVPGTVGPRGPAGERGPAGPIGPPGISPEELARMRTAIETLQRLAREFSDTLATLGTDVDQLKRDLAALRDRVGKVEETIAKMPKITGTATMAFIGSKLDGSDFRNFAGTGPRPTDIDGRPIPLDNNILETLDAIYDIDLGITAKLSDVATAKVLLNAGNYLKGYLNNSISTVTAVNSQSKSFDQVTAYYLYLDTPISFGGFGANITVGKFGQQFTPYTLKLIDVDSYLNNDKTDYGDYPILGGRVNFKIGGINVQYYAGKHEEIDYADLTSTAGVEQPPFFTTGAPLFFGNDSPLVPPPGTTQVLDQSQGARISFGVPLNGTLGLTWLQAAGSANSDTFRQLTVWGADLNATLFKRLKIGFEVDQSEWKNRFGQKTGVSKENDRRIWDARLGYRFFGKLDLTGYYKRLGVGYDAPGYWGTIGRWKNPRGLEGIGGMLSYPLGNRMSVSAEAADYRFIGLPDTNLRHYKAGLAFSLTSSNRVDLGYERAEYDPPTGDKATEQYINLGWGHNFSSTTSFKLLYQIINFNVGSTQINPLADYDAAVAVTQFTVRF
jgi:hypothetical protein